jgi:agmatine deiminase
MNNLEGGHTGSNISGLMPAEFGPHEETLMCWPVNSDVYGDQLADAEHAHAEVAQVIAKYEAVRMFAPADVADRAQKLCGASVHVDVVDIDDSWCRDTGPTYVYDQNDARVALDWIFNGWGQRFSSYQKDDVLAANIAHIRGDRCVRMHMVFEGGALQVNGRGFGVTTMQCLLNPNRNPTMSQSDIEDVLSDALGVSQLLWLPFGLSLDDDTDGHVDNIAALTPTGHLLLQGCLDDQEEDHMRTSVNEKIARGAIDAAEVPLQVEVIPVLPFVDTSRGRKSVPYVNYYVANGCVVVPTTGHDADQDMLSIIEAMYPKRDVVGVPVGAILALGGGGIHCITQQVPVAIHTGASQ